MVLLTETSLFRETPAAGTLVVLAVVLVVGEWEGAPAGAPWSVSLLLLLADHGELEPKEGSGVKLVPVVVANLVVGWLDESPGGTRPTVPYLQLVDPGIQAGDDGQDPVQCACWLPPNHAWTPCHCEDCGL